MCFVPFRPSSVDFEFRIEQLRFKFYSQGKHYFLAERKDLKKTTFTLEKYKIGHAWTLEQSIVVEKWLPERNLKKLCNTVCYCWLLFSLLK